MVPCMSSRAAAAWPIGCAALDPPVAVVVEMAPAEFDGCVEADDAGIGLERVILPDADPLDGVEAVGGAVALDGEVALDGAEMVEVAEAPDDPESLATAAFPVKAAESAAPGGAEELQPALSAKSQSSGQITICFRIAAISNISHFAHSPEIGWATSNTHDAYKNVSVCADAKASATVTKFSRRDEKLPT
jgi:hypothetical protein